MKTALTLQEEEAKRIIDIILSAPVPDRVLELSEVVKALRVHGYFVEFYRRFKLGRNSMASKGATVWDPTAPGSYYSVLTAPEEGHYNVYKVSRTIYVDAFL